MIRVNFLEAFRRDYRPSIARALVFFVAVSLAMTPVLTVAVEGDEEPVYPAPTMLAPADGTSVAVSKPVITGLALNGSLVKVFIDGTFNGQLMVTNDESGVGNFAYEPFLHLKPGSHTAYTIAENPNGKDSSRSDVLRFSVEQPMPAPVVFDTVVNPTTTKQRPWLVGVAVNDSLVQIFIDSRFNGQFTVKNHESGVANFAYRTLYDLTPGRHTYGAVAIDPDGKQSVMSGIVEFAVPDVEPDPTEPVVKGEETATNDETDDVTTEELDETVDDSNGQSIEGDTSDESMNENNDDGTEENNEDGDSESTDENTNEGADEAAASTDDDESGNWPLVVGLMVLAVVLIVIIDNLVRRSRGDKSEDNDKSGSSSTRQPDELFPPPPPDLK
ncbi:MAG: hypothetical protein Q8Q20_02795 [bacterium]|nr:hypothetical protein [bacterium]